MGESRRVAQTAYSGQTSMERTPNAIYGTEQYPLQEKSYQNIVSSQMNYMNGPANPAVAKCKKEHRRRTNFSITTIKGRIVGIQYYDNGCSDYIPVTEVEYGEISLIKLDVMNQPEYLIIQWGNCILPIIVRMSELTPASLYKEFKQKGIRFRVSWGISEAKIKQALYDYILSESSRCSRKIEKSG